MNTKEKNKNANRRIMFIIVSILIIAVVSLAGFAFARYITRLNGNATADILILPIFNLQKIRL